MSLRHFGRQHEQLSQFEIGRIVGMIEGRTQQTIHREDRHVVRNTHANSTASSAVTQAQIIPSLGAPVFSRTKRRCLTEGHLGSRCPLRVLLLTPTHRHIRLEGFRTKGNSAEEEWNQIVFSDGSRFNPSIPDNRVRVWRPRCERLNHVFAL
ncbi:transposable element Tcb2 transposase [Trichonephila clavipes]|uniref:Transposable element Tcb2 transposase n=1 Tax=Trichonephila clavipes TaxID=2585209 RepID=A0A8X6R624_TRICX|nr:transposable element Tcb2 transposase [Trichonephila clavipes]